MFYFPVGFALYGDTDLSWPSGSSQGLWCLTFSIPEMKEDLLVHTSNVFAANYRILENIKPPSQTSQSLQLPYTLARAEGTAGTAGMEVEVPETALAPLKSNSAKYNGKFASQTWEVPIPSSFPVRPPAWDSIWQVRFGEVFMVLNWWSASGVQQGEDTWMFRFTAQ